MRKVTSKDGTNIALDQLGEGQVVILVSGALVSRSDNAPLAALLALHFTVINYDRRGRGDSGDTAPYAVEREVEDIEALIKEAGGSAFVYGISSGAVLALEAAARGINIKKLALYEPLFMVDESGPRPPEDHEAQLRELISSGRRGDAVEFFMTKLVGLPAEFVAQARNEPWWTATENLARTLVYDAAIMGDYSLPSRRLASVTIPALVVYGEESDARLRHAAQAVTETLPNAQRHTLESQTHDVAPEALAPVLEEFFKADTIPG
jgi:pimeloyl-ACP methyl ester carboxylesterase